MRSLRDVIRALRLVDGSATITSALVAAGAAVTQWVQLGEPPLNLPHEHFARIARSRRFKTIRGGAVVWVSPGACGPEADPPVQALLPEEVIPFLPPHLAVEARVAGLSWWIEGCSPEEEADVADRAETWARGTGMTFSRRKRLKEQGRGIDLSGRTT